MFATRCIKLVKAVVIFTAALSAMGTRADEFDTLRLKWRDMITQGTNFNQYDPLYSAWIASVESTARSYSNSLNTSSNRTYLWSAYPNLATDSSDISGTFNRLRALALGYAVRGSASEGNVALRSNIISGLDWMYANYYNPTGVIYDNWFDFEISTPLALNDTVVLLYPNLSPTQISKYMSAVEHFTPSPAYSSIATNVTAANRVWKSLAVLLRGVIVKDAAKTDLGRTSLSDVFPSVTSGDGFYSDGSFIFHNEFPYTGGYGVELLDTMGAIFQLLQGSTWQVTDPAQTNLFRWVHESYEPFLFRGGLLPMVDGRYHTRTGDDHVAGHDLLGAILRIAQFAPPADAAAYKSFVKGMVQSDTCRDFVSKEIPPYNVWGSLVMNDTNVVPLVETARHQPFPSMDRVLHRQAGWALGLAMSSYRVANFESTRGENLHGWFTADGMTYLHNSDLSHYTDNFWSTVDPYRMPGTTIEAYARTNGSGDSYRSPTNNQVGSASIQGLYGVAAMHLNSYGSTLSARKSWFMFDNEIVCLGNSISGGTNGAAETIIENRRLGLYGNNALTVNGAAKPSGPGWFETMGGTSWAHLAGTAAGADIGYYFPTASNVKALRESRSGALKDINTTYGSSTKSTRHFLTMYYDHGTNPSNGTYAYVLLPGLSAPAVAAYAASPDITVIQNNSTATAVRENKLGITAVNYWRDTSNQVSGTSFDRKAAALWRSEGGILEIGASDPTQTNTVGITIELTNSVTAVLSVDAGVTVLQTSPLKLFFGTSNSLGVTLRARFSVTPVQTNTVSPVADSYVQNGTFSAANFGDASTLAVKSGGTNQSRETYMRFDLSSIPGTILSATLRLVTRTFDEPIYHALALVTNSTWVESGVGGITWNTKPTSGLPSVIWQVFTTNQTSSVPITALAQQARAGDGKLSFRIFSTGTNSTGVASNGGFIAYGSKENSTANRPQLLVTYIRTAPTVTLTSPADGTVMDAPGSVTLAADAGDSDGVISLVEFYNGTTRVGQFLNPPYTMALLNLAAGNYILTAVATDNSGLMATSGPVTVSVYTPEPVGRGTGLIGEYYNGVDLKNLVFTRTDPTVNFFWGASTNPVPDVHFSVRWMGKLQVQHAGVHQFHADTDDGARLWVDGRLVIDSWNTHPSYEQEYSGSISLLPGRYYNITMEYFDDVSTAVARLYWTQPGVAKEIVPQSQLYPADQGLRATYFLGTNLTNSAFVRIDDTVNFAWGTNSPDPTILPLPFSARWTGKVKANAAGLYHFFTTSDDAARLWVNGQLIINNWLAHALTEDSNTITLVAGQFYDLTLEYFNAAGAGTVVLSWQPPGEAKQVIPVGNLTPHQNNNPPALANVPNFIAARNGLFTFTASATDAEAPAQSLVFSLDAGAPSGASINSSSGVFTWTPSNAQAFGIYTLTARVTDTGSPPMSDAQTFTITLLTNVAAATVTLIPTGGIWRYLDTGFDQGSSWRNGNFNDAAWSSGAGALGYGIGGETTTHGYGPNPNNKFITTYFRRAVYIPDPSLVLSLTARLVRDDGAVVYFNNTEVWRDNLPPGAVAFGTLASTALSGSSQTQFITTAISPSVLVSGTNLIAVEIHQDSVMTPDARFDFELVAQALVPSSSVLSVLHTAGGTLLAWPEAAGLFRVFAATNLSLPVSWVPTTNAPLLSSGQWTVLFPATTNGTRFFRLQTP